MDPKTKEKILEKLSLPALVVALLGVVSMIVGVVFLILRNFPVGGILVGAGLAALLFGILGGMLVLVLIERNRRVRSKQISEDAYFVQGDWFVSFTADGMEVINSEKPEQCPCIPYDAIRLWSYYAYKFPIGRGRHKYTLRFATVNLPAEMEHVDRTKTNIYLDIEEERLANTLEKFNVAPIVKADLLKARPVKVAEYGKITVFDSGVYLAGLWMYDRSRFLPWEDVESITHEEDELVFDCGYQRIRALFSADFYRDLEANYPDKIPPEPEEAEEVEGEEELAEGGESEDPEELAEEVEENGSEEIEMEPVCENETVEAENEAVGDE